jgi:hypothetical protein
MQGSGAGPGECVDRRFEEPAADARPGGASEGRGRRGSGGDVIQIFVPDSADERGERRSMYGEAPGRVDAVAYGYPGVVADRDLDADVTGSLGERYAGWKRMRT